MRASYTASRFWSLKQVAIRDEIVFMGAVGAAKLRTLAKLTYFVLVSSPKKL